MKNNKVRILFGLMALGLSNFAGLGASQLFFGEHHFEGAQARELEKSPQDLKKFSDFESVLQESLVLPKIHSVDCRSTSHDRGRVLTPEKRKVKNFLLGSFSKESPLCSPKFFPFEHGFSSLNNTRGCGYLNQDNGCLVFLDEHICCFGIFDGHGSEPEATTVSKTVASQYPRYLSALQQASGLSYSDPRLYQEAAKRVEKGLERNKFLNTECAGTTAVVGVLHEGKLTVANTGDSRMIVIRHGKQIFATRDHDFTDEVDQDRIELSGGVIIDCGGVLRLQDTLAVSRAFGDTSMRPFGLTEEPEVYSLDIQFGDLIITASDGFWDVVGHGLDVYGHILGLFEGNPEKVIHPHAIAESLAEAAAALGSRDDITVLVIRVWESK